MLFTDHVQAIIKSAKSIVVARNYPELAPEHLMLALMPTEQKKAETNVPAFRYMGNEF